MKLRKGFFSTVTVSLLTLALPALAANDYGLGATAKEAGLKTGLAGKSVPEIVGSIIGVALSMIGIIFMILMLYGGFMWMTSSGNTQKVDKAKELITSAAIGLVIVIAAYALTNFVIGALVGGNAAATP